MKKTIIWATTFREFSGGENDGLQRYFLNSLKRIKDCEIILCCTTFGEKHVYSEVARLFPNAFIVDRKELLPQGARYSQTLVLDTALAAVESIPSVDALIWSTGDIILPQDFIASIGEKIWASSCVLSSHPHIKIGEGNVPKYMGCDSGFDLVMYSNPKPVSQRLRQLNLSYPTVDWGVYEHLLLAFASVLNLDRHNLFDEVKILKFFNDRAATNESGEWLQTSFQRNAAILMKLLEQTNTPTEFANLGWCSAWISNRI